MAMRARTLGGAAGWGISLRMAGLSAGTFLLTCWRSAARRARINWTWMSKSIFGVAAAAAPAASLPPASFCGPAHGTGGRKKLWLRNVRGRPGSPLMLLSAAKVWLSLAEA